MGLPASSCSFLQARPPGCLSLPPSLPQQKTRRRAGVTRRAALRGAREAPRLHPWEARGLAGAAPLAQRRRRCCSVHVGTTPTAAPPRRPIPRRERLRRREAACGAGGDAPDPARGHCRRVRWRCSAERGQVCVWRRRVSGSSGSVCQGERCTFLTVFQPHPHLRRCPCPSLFGKARQKLPPLAVVHALVASPGGAERGRFLGETLAWSCQQSACGQYCELCGHGCRRSLVRFLPLPERGKQAWANLPPRVDHRQLHLPTHPYTAAWSCLAQPALGTTALKAGCVNTGLMQVDQRLGLPLCSPSRLKRPQCASAGAPPGWLGGSCRGQSQIGEKAHYGPRLSLWSKGSYTFQAD